MNYFELNGSEGATAYVIVLCSNILTWDLDVDGFKLFSFELSNKFSYQYFFV